MKPIITGRWEIVPRNQAWAFTANILTCAFGLPWPALHLQPLSSGFCCTADTGAIRRPVNKTQAQQALENLKN